MSVNGVSIAAAVVASLTALACASGALYASERLRPALTRVDAESTPYLRSPALMSRLFLSFDALAADVYWMRTIQYYGRNRHVPGSRFERLDPLLDVTTTLDPRFNVAYRFGAIFLALDPPNGPGRPDRAIRLLEKGLSSNPGRWQYAHDIGFVHYWHTNRFDLAADWFGRAARMSGAPPWLAPLGAVTRVRGGDRQGARQLLSELLAADERYIRQASERALLQLQALDELDRLAALVQAYHQRTGHYPNDLQAMVDLGLLTALPLDPTGRPYVYSPADRRADVSSQSILSPLPAAFRR
jgi:hypothetical protein